MINRITIALLAAGLAVLQLLVFVSPATAATFRTLVAQTPASPTGADVVSVWMNSDTVVGESAGIEYKIGDKFVKVLGTFDTSFEGANWRADIPAQPAGTVVEYQLFTRNQSGMDYGFTGFQWTYTVQPRVLTDARALWLDRSTLAWNGAPAAAYKLLYEAGGNIDDLAAASFIPLKDTGTVSGYAKNPNATGLKKLTLDSTGNITDVLKGEVAVAAYDGNGMVLDATRVQIQGVLDALYAASAKTQLLGPSRNDDRVSVALWAPTARSVTLLRFADSMTPISTTHPMRLDPASGIWSASGPSSWDRQFYLFDVEVYVPALDRIVHNVVSDPYAVSLSTDSNAAADPRSQFVSLDDSDLKPAGWDSLSRPPLAAPEDMAIYEVHVRDFSIADSSVITPADRGTFRAFTYDGTNGRPLSAGMNHLKQLQAAGLTHIHLLPVFDIASVDEKAIERTEPDASALALYARDAITQQEIVSATRSVDGFNWGYDPFHYGTPEGSYSTDPDGVERNREFREMIQTLHNNGLRVVMDVVYNHTAAAGQDEKSVLDKIVPGYYYRLDTNGTLQTSSCCPDTASEYEMMEDLMVDTVLGWANAYKIDAFRFDLMNLHTKQNMLDIRDALAATDPTIYVYGEGWDFGSAAAKGLVYAKQANMTGTGIGTFNDHIRDAAHGGYNTDPLQIRHQGFINGLSYDWNGYCYNNRGQSDLRHEMERLRVALAGSGADYTDDPQETINYVEKHDNETLFDQNVFKLPGGVGDPGACGGGAYVVPETSVADRVRAQNMGLSIVALAQGIPFFQMGSDILRSKSLDRNSYDSGDWFNRVDWTYTDNNFGKGLPPAWDNSSRWSIMGPLLADTRLSPATVDMLAGAAQLRELLRLRGSSPLFRLRTESDAKQRITFFNAGANPQDALIVMGLSDMASPDLDPNYEYILVFFNANKVTQTITIPEMAGVPFALHPLQADDEDADPIVKTALVTATTGTFQVPARTTAVFVSAQAPELPSDIGFVGRMYPRGGQSHDIGQGNAATALDVFVQVYQPAVTPGGGQGAGLQCYLHWGRYGSPFADLPMVYNGDIGNNDEYKATITRAALDGLTPGQYGFTSYCTDDGGATKKWKEDLFGIDGNFADDDHGDGIITVIPGVDASPTPPGGTFVHLFEWKWTDIEKECTFLSQKGYQAVQVSPPMEHVVPLANMGSPNNDYPWWVRYQPVSYKLDHSRSGTLAEFQSMVNTCRKQGVDIYVDAVINHMTGVGSGTGSAGSMYTPYDYPDYDPSDFHACGTPGNEIASYRDRTQVQSCELVNLADLDTASPTVRAKIHAYLQGLLDMGVAGFRIDAAKHIASQDIAAILDGLKGRDGAKPYVFQEVIDQGGEPIQSFEYTPNGDVSEFKYSVALGNIFNCGGSLSALRTVDRGLLDGSRAVVFTDNHDNQRGHGAGGACIVDHRDGQVYNLADIFMLAFPYGYPSVMSSYVWDGIHDSYGPPSTTGGGAGSGAETIEVYGPGQEAGDTPLRCGDGVNWVCEHRRTPIANMVAFRSVTDGEPVTGWVDVSANHIAFGRGGKGYVAINRESTSNTRTYMTNLPAGLYCDIVHYDFTEGRCIVPGTGTAAPTGSLIAVDAEGRIVDKTVASMDAFAIHIGARID